MSFQVGALKFSFVADAGRLMDALNKASESVSRFMGQVKRAANDFAQFTGMMSAGVFAATSLAATIDQRALTSINNLKEAGGLLAVQVSDVVKPGIDALTRALEEMARFVAGMSPELKAAVSAMAEWGVQAAVVSKIVGSIAGFASAAIQALTGIATAIGGISVVSLVSVFGWLAAIAINVAILHAAWRKNFLGMRDAVTNWANDVARIFQGIFDFINKVFRAMTAEFVKNAKAALVWAEAMAFIWHKGEIPESLIKSFAVVREKLNELRKSNIGEAIKLSFDTIKDAAATAGEIAVDAFVSEWSRIADKLGLDAIATKVKGIFSSTGAAPRAPGGIQSFEVGNVSNDNGGAMAFYEKLADIQRVADDKMVQYHDDASKAHYQSLGEEWDRAAKESAAAEEAAAAAASRARQYFASLVTSTLGEAGQAISNIAQGGASAGIWGVIAAAAAEMLKKSEAFQKFLTFLTEALGRFGEMIDPVFKVFEKLLTSTTAFHTESFAPIFEVLGEILGVVADILEPFMAGFATFGNLIKVVLLALRPIINVLKVVLQIVGGVLGAVFKALYDMANGIMRFLVSIMDGIIDIWNGLLSAVAEVAAFFANLFSGGKDGAKARKDVMKAAGNHEGTNKMMKELEEASYEMAQAQIAASGAAWDAKLSNEANTKAVDKSTEAAQRAYEALTNVPSGFKVAMARFNATEAELGAKAETAVKYATGEGSAAALKKPTEKTATEIQREATNNYRIEQMTIYAKSEGFNTLEAMKREARKERARDRGNPYGKGEGGGY